MEPIAWGVTLFGIWLATAVVLQISALALLGRLLARCRCPRGSFPKADGSSDRAAAAECCILMPCTGDSRACETRIEALSRLGVPIVVGVDESATGFREVLERLQATHSAARIHLVVARATGGGNRKIEKLLQMLPATAGAEILIFCDGDIVVRPGYLAAVLSPFSDPAVGVATCPYRSLSGKRVAARLDVLLTNTVFLPSVALAYGLEGVRFGLGATIAIRRRVLNGIGGLEPFKNCLADDYELTARAVAGGHKIALLPLLLDHCCDGEETFLNVCRRHLRWARTVRSVRPFGYYNAGIAHGLPAAAGLAIVMLVSGASALAAALPPVFWIGLRFSGAALHRRPLGLLWSDPFLLPLADLLSFAVYLAGGVGRTVVWSGRKLRIRRGGIIEAAEPNP